MEIEKEKNIYQKLQECRCELQKMNLKKSGQNKFAGFNYYELGDFIPQVNELFCTHGLFSNFSIENEQAKLTIYNSDKSEESIEFTSPIADANIKGCTPVQSLGGVHTYLKRYLYMNALEIVESDLFDSKTGDMEIPETETTNKTTKTATPNQIKVLKENYTGDNLTKLLEANGISKLEEMPIQKASELIGKLKERGNK